MKPNYADILEWVKIGQLQFERYDGNEIIQKSFKRAGISLALDGTEDDGFINILIRNILHI